MIAQLIHNLNKPPRDKREEMVRKLPEQNLDSSFTGRSL